MKNKKNQNPTKLVIIAAIMIALVVGYYFHVSNKTQEVKENNVQISHVDEVLLRNLETDYPPSPKEVVKYYAEITKCFYDGGYSEEQLKKLAAKSRELFDNELRANQSDEAYLSDLKATIIDYQKQNLRISSYSTSSSVDVSYSESPKGELATLYCMYNLRSGSTLMGSNHEFILRKDDKGHWKILGWMLEQNSK